MSVQSVIIPNNNNIINRTYNVPQYTMYSNSPSATSQLMDLTSQRPVLDLLHARRVSPVVLTHKPAQSARYPDSLTSFAPSVRKSANVLTSSTTNYCSFNQQKVDYFVKQKEQALPYLSDILAHSNNEAQITETLYIVDRMIDGGTKGVDKMYPVLSRFNQTNSPFIQTFLAGIYRKIQVPDAFGPLVAMLIRNSVNPPQTNFDPNEEVGGAILAYLSDRFRK